MQPELTKRLMAEAIGTFGFFFTGFCGIAALVTQGLERSNRSGSRWGSGSAWG